MQGASMAQTQSNALALPQTAQAPELGSGWRCVKSEDYGQTYIFEPSLPANSPTPGPVATPWGPSYPMGMAQAMSSESTARNRATLEEATNSAHFESTFFMSPLGGDGYGKTSRDIPSTIAPGRTAPALGSFDAAPTNPYITSSGMVAQPTVQMPMIAGGGGLPVGYAAGGASAVGMMNNAAGGLSLTAQPGSWVISQAQGQQSSGNSPSLLPGGLSRVSLNHMHGAHEGQQMGMMGSGMMGQQMGQQAQMQSQMQAQYQRMAALNQLASLERIAALNQSRMGAGAMY